MVRHHHIGAGGIQLLHALGFDARFAGCEDRRTPVASASVHASTTAVDERDQLQGVLRHGANPGEGFDTDLMFWRNGWVTLFSAVHICLGDVDVDGAEVIFCRRRKDPLVRALADFDRRLLAFYSEVREDLDERIRRATSPHQLFHSITEDAQIIP